MAVNAAYRLVPNTPYSYAQVELPEGAHHVEADAPFGIVCYGYGLANSYGYPGGMLFRPIVGDSRLPRLGGLIDCSGYRGHAVDNRLTDDGVDSVELVTAKSANVTFSTEPFASGADSVAWRVGLIDPYQDGVLVVRARDSAGWAQEFRRDVPGFTIGIGANGSATPAVERRPAYNGAEICVDVTLTNYGRFTQTVQGLRIESDPSFRVDTPFPLEIGPGGETDVRVCFASGIDTVYNVALVADNGCHDRDVALLEIVSILDTAGPTSLAAGVGCDAPVTAVVSFADGLRDFYGVADLSVVSIENGELASVNPSDFPASSIEVRVRQTDPFAETPFTLQVTDRAGNVTLYTDTLGAFTTHAYDRVDGLTLGTRTGNGWDVASIDFRSDRCDTILLVNEGTRPVELDRAHLGSNLGVSFPPSQLPVNVEPGDTLELAICFEGLRAGPGSDTLFLYDACGRFDKIEIATSVGFGDGAGVDRCGQQLHVQAFEAAKQTFLQTPFPSPSHGEQIGVDLGLDQDTEVSIDILDPTGLVRLRIIDESSLAAGVHRLTFTTLDLESGTFFCRLVTTEGEVHTVPFVLRK